MPQDKRLDRIITIKSPRGFRRSISTLREGEITLKEKRALVLAQNRARVQLKRKNLSPSERKQLRSLASLKLPKITKR